MAAVGEVLGAAGRVAREGEGQREATGGGGGRPRRVGASARRINGREGRGGAPRRWRAALSAAREKTEQGGWRWKKRVVLQLPKVPGTKL